MHNQPSKIAGAHLRSLNRLVRRVRYHLRKGRSLTLPANVWEGAKAKDYEHDGDVVNRIAEKAGCDWLINCRTRESHFYL